MIASGDRFANALVEGVEGGLGMDQTAKAVVDTNKDAAVEAVVDAVAGLEHGTIARHSAVGTNKLKFRAQITGRVCIQAGHLAGVLFALDEGEDVLAGGDAGIAVFEGVADAIAIDGEVTVGVLTFNAGSCYNDIHTFNI